MSDDAEVKAVLLEVMWRRQRGTEVLDFLSQAVRDANPVVWKGAIDGIVSIGGTYAIEILQTAASEIKEGQLKHEWISEAIGQIQPD